jgi:hypothetical protein
MEKIRSYSVDDEPILSEEEQEIIVEWTRNNYQYFIYNGKNKEDPRYRQHLDFFKEVPCVFYDIKQRIIDKEDLHRYQQEPIFRDSIAYAKHGSQLHRHVDPNRFGLIHVRFNVYVQLPYQGGTPVYGNKDIILKERTYVCCRSGLDLHYAKKVIGERERIVISYGFLIPKEEIGEIKYDYPSFLFD